MILRDAFDGPVRSHCFQSNLESILSKHCSSAQTLLLPATPGERNTDGCSLTVGEHFNQSFGNALEGSEGHFLETARTVFLEMFWSWFWADVRNEWAHRSCFYTLDDSCAGDFCDLPLFLCLFLNETETRFKDASLCQRFLKNNLFERL